MSVLSHPEYKILIDEPFTALNQYITDLAPSQIIVLVDENTAHHCLPVFKENIDFPFSQIEIAAGEKLKNLDTCHTIWQKMLLANMDRHSLLINLGGGVIGDMGGFVASTYKRGIAFIQMPTTLLSQVDASVGGKLGIDFEYQKNAIGLFNNPAQVFVHTPFLKTLDKREIGSGFAEIIKHGLIQSSELWQQIRKMNAIASSINFSSLIQHSVNLKLEVVLADPYESGKRKILNFGHSIGHAIESFYLENDLDIRHGEAIAAGMICESYLSTQLCHLEMVQLAQISDFISRQYTYLDSLMNADDTIIHFCRKDKKNRDKHMQFCLIKSIGDAIFDQEVGEELIRSSLAYYHSLYKV